MYPTPYHERELKLGEGGCYPESKATLQTAEINSPFNLRSTAAASQHYRSMNTAKRQHLPPCIWGLLFFGKCGRKDSQREDQLLYLSKREAPGKRNKKHRAHPWTLCASPLCALKGLFVSHTHIHTHTPSESVWFIGGRRGKKGDFIIPLLTQSQQISAGAQAWWPLSGSVPSACGRRDKRGEATKQKQSSI